MKGRLVVISSASLAFLSYMLCIMTGKAKKFKVVLEFDLETIQEIDRKVYELSIDGKASRASVCKAIVLYALNQGMETQEQKLGVHNRLIKEAIRLKDCANKLINKREFRQASSLFILSAAKELEALSVVPDRSEKIIRSCIIHAVQALKNGTGYKTLPDIPASKVNVDSAS
jgi:hypothetical protein